MKFSQPIRSEASERLSRLWAGLAQLLDARAYADDRQCDPWEFAVAMDDLAARGMTTGDLRWLASKGYAEHACETTGPDDAHRTFQRVRNLSFRDATCVVLTDPGRSFAAAVVGKRFNLAMFQPPDEDAPLARERMPQPHWDRQRRELRLGDAVVKRFPNRSSNQEAILAAFEEEGWPRRVDDPLPPKAEQDSKCRLHDTIKCLNRRQQQQLIRFRGDGTGEGICWESIGEPAVPLSRESKPKKIRLAA